MRVVNSKVSGRFGRSSSYDMDILLAKTKFLGAVVALVVSCRITLALLKN
jgi:hypothetical protein